MLLVPLCYRGLQQWKCGSWFWALLGVGWPTCRAWNKWVLVVVKWPTTKTQYSTDQTVKLALVSRGLLVGHLWNALWGVGWNKEALSWKSRVSSVSWVPVPARCSRAQWTQTIIAAWDGQLVLSWGVEGHGQETGTKKLRFRKVMRNLIRQMSGQVISLRMTTGQVN